MNEPVPYSGTPDKTEAEAKAQLDQILENSSILPLIRRVNNREPWRASQFSPFAAHVQVWQLKEAVAELQAVVAVLIDERNKGK